MATHSFSTSIARLSVSLAIRWTISRILQRSSQTRLLHSFTDRNRIRASDVFALTLLYIQCHDHAWITRKPTYHETKFSSDSSQNTLFIVRKLKLNIFLSISFTAPVAFLIINKGFLVVQHLFMHSIEFPVKVRAR